MPRFGNRKRQNVKLARGVFTIRRGIGFLQAGEYDNALREFRKVIGSRHHQTSQLVRGVASFYAYNTVRFRKEQEKIRRGNGHAMALPPGNTRDAWSDVDIAAVMVTPRNRFTSQFLVRFLGRTGEAIRFQRRYVSDNPLPSWTAETGNQYTRFTQACTVAEKMGITA